MRQRNWRISRVCLPVLSAFRLPGGAPGPLGRAARTALGALLLDLELEFMNLFLEIFRRQGIVELAESFFQHFRDIPLVFFFRIQWPLVGKPWNLLDNRAVAGLATDQALQHLGDLGIGPHDPSRGGETGNPVGFFGGRDFQALGHQLGALLEAPLKLRGGEGFPRCAKGLTRGGVRNG